MNTRDRQAELADDFEIQLRRGLDRLAADTQTSTPDAFDPDVLPIATLTMPESRRWTPYIVTAAAATIAVVGLTTLQQNGSTPDEGTAAYQPFTSSPSESPASCDNPTNPIAVVSAYPSIDGIAAEGLGFSGRIDLIDTATCTPIDTTPYTFTAVVDDPTVAEVLDMGQSYGSPTTVVGGPSTPSQVTAEPQLFGRFSLAFRNPGQTTVRVTVTDRAGTVVGTTTIPVTVRTPVAAAGWAASELEPSQAYWAAVWQAREIVIGRCMATFGYDFKPRPFGSNAAMTQTEWDEWFNEQVAADPAFERTLFGEPSDQQTGGCQLEAFRAVHGPGEEAYSKMSNLMNQMLGDLPTDVERSDANVAAWIEAHRAKVDDIKAELAQEHATAQSILDAAGN
jgi:hypothetical protein